MRLLSLSLLLCCVVPLSASAQAGRNPFVPQPAASAAAAATSGFKPSAPVVPRTTSPVRLPDSRPGTYKPGATVTIPLPPPGMPALALPPDASLPATDTTTAPASNNTAVNPTTTPPKVEKKNDIFYTAEQLQAQRSKCAVALKSASLVNAAPAGASYTVRLVITGGRSCVKGVASNQEWVHVSDVSEDGSLTLKVEENDSDEDREAEVNVANTGTSLRVVVRQLPL